MKVPFVDLSRIHIPLKEEIRAALDSVLHSGAFILGRHVDQFESDFAAYIGTKYCVGCANGTDAIELALEALGLSAGDEVIVPAHTWISTASAVVKVGATPIVADTLHNEFTIDPEAFERSISPRTKAVILVHLYGSPVRLTEILTIARKHNLLVIEDCAQAHGATYGGQKVGSFGDIACFSFYPSKNLGALGDGGAITTNSSELEQKLRMFINCGQAGKNNIKVIARNSRLDGFQAAVLSIKLKHLDRWNMERREAASFYYKHIANEHIQLPVEAEGTAHVYHLFVVKSAFRQSLIADFDTAGIGHGIHYPFMLNEFFHAPEPITVSQAYLPQILSLPIFAGITIEELQRVVEVVNATKPIAFSKISKAPEQV